jgi:hypothetical protein
MGQCKYHVEIGNRQKVLTALFYPPFTVGVLAFRAVPVPTGVVADTYAPATGTDVPVIAHCRCAAIEYGTDGLAYVTVWMVFVNKAIAKTSDNIGHFKSRLHF